MQTRKHNRRLLYASNVSHVAHLDHLLNWSDWEIFIMRPWVPKKWIITISGFISKRFSTTLSSREKDLISNHNYVSLTLGLSQFYAPIKNIIKGSPLSQKELKLIEWRLSKKVESKISNMNVIIMTRDIFPKIKNPSGQIFLAEMRENHPLNSWNRLETLAGYPYDSEKNQAIKDTYLKKFEIIKANASGLLTYSTIAKDSFSLNGFPADKIFVFPLKFPQLTTPQGSINRDPNCLFVGRDDPNKGLDLAVLATKKANVKLRVVGHYSNDVIKWIKKFEHVEYIGPVNRRQMHELMSTTHTLLAPSLESYGLSVIEALDSGCLIVSSKLNGAAATFEHSPNVFCAEKLELSAITEQLDKALNSNYSYVEQIPQEDFSIKFLEYLNKINYHENY